MAAGVAAETFARHARIPAILPLLAFGVLLGPDGAGIIEPQALGDGLFALVEIGVVVVLFEGGLGLEIGKLRRGEKPIRYLVTIGAAITALGGALAARLALEWPWSQSLLFGTLVIVTGPTVIAPLLRHVRVRSRVATILEAEGVLIDPIGAIVAAVALQIALGAHESMASGGFGALASRLALGLVVGGVGGAALALLLRSQRLVPIGIANLVALGGALSLFAICEATLSQTGVLAVTLAGVVVGNVRTGVDRELREFHGLLTIGLIGVLFVLLAADVRLAEVQALGLPGLVATAILLLLVRPIQVFACTLGSKLEPRERLFLAWVAPRGIVAAGIASLFAESLTLAGLPGGGEIRALVFLVIAVSVLQQGTTAGVVARALGVGIPARDVFVILGANELALAFADALARGGRSVRLVDANPAHCRSAEERGFAVVFGNALEAPTLARARLGEAAAVVGLTPNDEINSVFTREAREEFEVPASYVALGRASTGSSETALLRGNRLLFDRPKDVERWSTRIRHASVLLGTWRCTGAKAESAEATPAGGSAADPWIMLTVTRAGSIEPMHAEWKATEGDVASVLCHTPERDTAEATLRARGWEPVPDPAFA